MKTEDIDKKIGMPDIDAEWAKFRKEVIAPSQGGRILPAMGMWRKIAAVVVALVCISGISIASAMYIARVVQDRKPVIDKTGETHPLVEYRQVNKHRIGYQVCVCPGTYVEINGKGHIEEIFNFYFFVDLGHTTMMLDSVPFDPTCLPQLSNKDLQMVTETINGDTVVVNLVTRDARMPADAKGNLPRIHTIVLPGDGSVYFLERRATEGDWVNVNITSWEPDKYDFCLAEHIKPSMNKPGYKTLIYASTETPQSEIDHAIAYLTELGVRNYEVKADLPICHWTDAQYREWAQAQKTKHPEYDYNYLFQELGKTHVYDDLHTRWHIIKEVYGVK